MPARPPGVALDCAGGRVGYRGRRGPAGVERHLSIFDAPRVLGTTVSTIPAGDGIFLGAAAVIANLHLVITVDSAIAHLAGAIGRPVWTFVQIAPDWRWMLGRASSPWYPSMRPVRQTVYGDWPGAIGTRRRRWTRWRAPRRLHHCHRRLAESSARM